MARDNSTARGVARRPGRSEEEAAALLHHAATHTRDSIGDEHDDGDDDDDDDDDIVVFDAPASPVEGHHPGPPPRQSSFAQIRPHGQPRTPHRVRFDVADPDAIRQANGHVHSHTWLDQEDYMDGRVSPGGQPRAPLLTGVAAPSVALANHVEFEDDLLAERPRSGLKSAFMNMANSIIGAGIIGQPYAFKQAGLLTGTALLIVLTLTVDWTIRLIVKNSKLSGTRSFQETMAHCFGKSGLVAISVAQWAFAFGGMVAFCVIIGDTIPRVLASILPNLHTIPVVGLLAHRKAIIVLFTLGISYPLSLYRDIAMLAKASTLALMSMIVIIVTVVVQGPLAPSDLKGPIEGSLVIRPGVVQAIGVISFAFVCHHNSLLIYGSLRTPTMDRFATVTHWSAGVSMLACLVLALAGYLSFGSKTQGNVLNNFPTGNVMVNLARLCFGLNMLTTLPLECFVCREVMTLYYFPAEPFHPNRHLVFTTALVLAAAGTALVTCDLGVVFELVGATSACALAYILPPLCFVKLSKKQPTWEHWAAYACIAFGSVVMGISVVHAFAQMARGGMGGHRCSSVPP